MSQFSFAAARPAVVLAAVPCLLFGTVAARGQAAGTASIQGSIKDASGASVPNAAVLFTNTETGSKRETKSGSDGNYSLPNIPVGKYMLTVSSPGFKGFTQTGTLEVGNSTSVDPVLQVGSESEVVEVTSQGAALETESSSYKQVIDQERITELPLNGRQATQLVLVSGGAVTAPTGDLVGSKTYFSSTVIAVAGSQGNYNNYALDGGTHTDSFTNTNLPYPFPDALREFSVESNSLPARNGLHPGALVNVVTRSGTNQWHGTVFEFLRNNIINANNFFSGARDTLKRSQFGGTLGGKIKTDKLFFFGGFQGTRNRQVGNATNYCLPTDAELAGDFSQQGGSCASAAIGTATTGGVTTYNPLVNPADGSSISTTPGSANFRKTNPSTYAKQSLALIPYLAEPRSRADKFGFVSVALPANYTEDQYIGRVDYTFSAKHSIFGRYYLTQYKQPSYFSPTNLLLTTAPGNDERVQTFTLGDTFILSPNLVNTFHGTYARRRDNRGPTAGGINAQTVGVNIYTYVPIDFRVSVSNGPSFGCGTCSPGFFNTNTEDFTDDVDYLHGKHAFAFGAEIIRTGDNTVSGYLQNGSFTFNGQLSGAKNKNVGEGILDFLTGHMQTFSQSRAQPTTFRQTIFSAYAQDTWHATQRLTITAGLRWEPFLMQQDKFGRGSTFSQTAFNANQHSAKYPNAPAGSFYFGDAGVPKSFTDNRLANFSPRVGITLDPYGTGKTVFRFGGAIMYDSPGLFASQRLASNPPFTNQVDKTGDVLFANPWNGASPFPGVFPPDATSTFFANTLYVVMPRNVQNPVVNQWTASLQQDLGKGWNMSLNYLGNKNSHLWLGRALNPSVYIPGTSTGVAGSCGALATLPAAGAACSTTGNANNRTLLSLQNPSQGLLYSPTFTIVDDGANSNYNGLIAAVQHRVSGSFSFLANYTWSKAIAPGDTNGDVTAPVYSQPNNRRADRGPAGFDVRHIFNTTIVARSDFKGLPRYAGALVNGWEIAPLIRLLSGLPLNLTTGSDVSLNGQGLDRPNMVANVPLYTKQKVFSSVGNTGANRAYINRAAFTAAPTGTSGNIGRNALRAPNTYTIDTSVSRRFHIYEHLDMNLRLEGFNILNHPNFTGFTTANPSSANFGYVTAAADARIFQAAAKFTF